MTKSVPDPDPGPVALEDLLDRHERQGVLDGRIVIDDWAGGIEETKARMPQLRLGRRWVSSLWLIPITGVGLIGAIAIAQQLRTYGWMQDFIRAYPGAGGDYAPTITTGLPAWLRIQHLLNLMFMLFIIRAGLQILADHPRLYLNAGCKPGTEWLRLRGPIPPDRQDPRDAARVWTAKDDSVALPRWLGLPGFRHSIGLARWWHFSFDLLWLVNGVVFFVLLFATGEWRRVVPQAWDVFPNALSATIQYASLTFPPDIGFSKYNGLQQLTYFITLFVAAPLAFVTGLLQAPAIAGKFGTGAGLLNRQVARTIHFTILLWFLFFITVHVTMVCITGLLANLNHIVLGSDGSSWWAPTIFAVVMAVLVALWLWASPFTTRRPRTVQKIGGFTVGWIKGAMEWWNPRATYAEKDISPYFWPNGERPTSDEYARLRDGGWRDYTLRVEGLVERPIELSYAELLAMPKREQITQHFCIQGWSGVAKWSGVAMSDVLALARPTPRAKWVVFYAFSDGPETPETGRYYDCHTIENMQHDLTILAYEMNGEPLSETHGAPLRLRDEAELGFKQVKWIEAIELVADFHHIGAGQGGYNEDQEFYGYRMPI